MGLIISTFLNVSEAVKNLNRKKASFSEITENGIFIELTGSLQSLPQKCFYFSFFVYWG